MYVDFIYIKIIITLQIMGFIVTFDTPMQLHIVPIILLH